MGDFGNKAKSWIQRWWRAFFSEFIQSFLLVMLGIASHSPHYDEKMNPVTPPLAHPAMTFGFIIMTNLHIFAPISGGHMTAAITLGALIDGRIPAPAALGYMISQILGAICGFYLLVILMPYELFLSPSGCTFPGVGVSPFTALVVEIIMAMVLLLLCRNVWLAHEAGQHDPAISIKFGLMIVALAYAGGPLTGASLNPARSFAPALINWARGSAGRNPWEHHWVYWIGPLAGGAIGVLLHKLLVPAPKPRAVDNEDDKL